MRLELIVSFSSSINMKPKVIYINLYKTKGSFHQNMYCYTATLHKPAEPLCVCVCVYKYSV